jgi:hypothetical protein
MYISITGLKPKGLIGWIRFWTLTIPASKNAQKADGILHCAFNSRNGYKHTLTVWQSKEHMLAYLSSPSHLKAMKFSSKIGSGKVYGYEANSIPSWEDAFTNWDKNGRMY